MELKTSIESGLITNVGSEINLENFGSVRLHCIPILSKSKNNVFHNGALNDVKKK